MKHIRYYAIGHSYLLHGPFNGWQTSGYWGMAASKPENDYFHKLMEHLRTHFDAKIEALPENHADYERLCTVGATEGKYTESMYYAHIREVLTRFKPNLITVFIGGGNTLAKDDESLARFYEVLYALIARHKREEAVVVCPAMFPNIYRIAKPIANRYGFLCVDISFIHQIRGRENPYYAYRDYPEYDAVQEKGGVEFRTHPNNKGHAAIADAIFKAASQAISQIEDGEFSEGYEYDTFLAKNPPLFLNIKTVPAMSVSYYGFNVRQKGDCVSFGAAPETGASLLAEQIKATKPIHTLRAEMAIAGAKSGEKLNLSVKYEDGEEFCSIKILDEEMHPYEFTLEDSAQRIESFRIFPDSKECVITIKSILLI